MLRQRTPQENKKDEISNFVDSVLGADTYRLKLIRLDCVENFTKNETTAKLQMTANNRKDRIKCSGQGVGIMHSLFLCLKELYAVEYPSLREIELKSFAANTYLGSPDLPNKIEACVEIVVEFENAYGQVTPFRASSSSLLKSAAMSLVSAIQYYINAEKAFLKLRSLIKDAEERKRSDIKMDLVYKITKIVGVSSYEELVSQ